MEVYEYQKLAMRTNDGKATQRVLDKIHGEILCYESKYDIGGIENACLGLSGELGEVTDMIKKWKFHGHLLDENNVKKEIGDILWYIAMLCESLHFSMDEIMQMNIDKLKKRYPDGFSEKASQNRVE